MRTRTYLFSSLNNGQKSLRNFTKVPYSRFSLNFLEILQKEGYISHWHLEKSACSTSTVAKPYTPTGSFVKDEITVYFKNSSFLTSQRPFKITAISKKTKPAYISLKSLWTFTSPDKLLILSTNRGLMTDRQARAFSLGGELICSISY